MSPLRLVVVASLLLAACATTPPPQETPPSPAPVVVDALTPTATQLEADTPLQSSSGATFTVSKGWFVTRNDDVIVLEDPEREMKMVLLENTAASADEAAQLAWKRFTPDFSRAIKSTVRPPARDGWDEFAQTVYETGTAENRVVLSVMRRKDKNWYVALVDAPVAAMDKRGAQLMVAVGSFKVAGAVEESFAGKAAHRLDAERLKAFEAFVEDTRIKTGVPGAAIALIQGGKVVFEKGFGVRELGKKDPVTPNTLFMIGSTTKSLTTFMMARLVDEGLVSWDTPVKKLLPSFALADADMTNKTQLLHTVCACAGLPRQDLEFIFEYATVTPEMRVQSMRSMQPTTGFGETFQYSNTMVSTGGFVAALAASKKKSLGPAYDEVMQSRVFGPLGMKNSTFDFTQVAKREHAIPHGRNLKFEYLPVPLSWDQTVVPVRPAGGAWSNAKDMIRYVSTELRNGTTPEGVRVVSEKVLLKRREPQVKISATVQYGLGFFLEDDHGVQVVAHGGNTLGFTSEMFFLPEHGVGVVMLTNAAGSNVFTRAARRRLMELLFDGKPEAAESLAFSLKQREETKSRLQAELSATSDAEWLARVIGNYQNASLGNLSIRTEGAETILDAGEWKSPIARKVAKDGSVKLVLTGAPLAGLEFLTLEKDGRVKLTLEDSQQKYEFDHVK